MGLFSKIKEKFKLKVKSAKDKVVEAKYRVDHKNEIPFCAYCKSANPTVKKYGVMWHKKCLKRLVKHGKKLYK